jgi:hypothetical protein
MSIHPIKVFTKQINRFYLVIQGNINQGANQKTAKVCTFISETGIKEPYSRQRQKKNNI